MESHTTQWNATGQRTLISLSFLISTFVSVAILLLFMVQSERLHHWFVIPALLCGILIGIDAVDWFRNRYDKFDPFGIIGLLGYHFFFLAPLLHVYWGYYPFFRAPLSVDPRHWLGMMALLNIGGVLIYRLTRQIRWEGNRARRSIWQLSPTRFAIFLVLALIVSALLQTYIYAEKGGISGFIRAYEEERARAFEGKGWFFTISESFPILAMMGFAVIARRHAFLRTWGVLAIVAVIFFALQLYFGGLRGSRSSTIFALFWATGIVHFWVRRIPRPVIYMGIAFLLTYMYVYRFYKHSGSEAFQSLATEEGQRRLERYTGNAMMYTLLVDLARADMQAFLLYRLNRPQCDYDYAFGRTYLAALVSVVPRAIWPDKPPNKAMEGTQLQFGKYRYRGMKTASACVYGLGGEAMLNFGYLAVPFAYVVLGLVTGYTRRWILSLHPDDMRLLLCPFMINFSFNFLVGDLDNVMFFVFKNGLMPSLVLLAGTRRRWLTPAPSAEPASTPTNRWIRDLSSPPKHTPVPEG
ncbi:MAG: hypothetical protein RMJ43_02555 [Chloroherpetonaceae bacterium]|nr:hypothetical protein [Chloroherpetonaceae bacterium]